MFVLPQLHRRLNLLLKKLKLRLILLAQHMGRLHQLHQHYKKYHRHHHLNWLRLVFQSLVRHQSVRRLRHPIRKD